jgi:hypothetical protein
MSQSIRIGIGDNGNNTASIDVYCSADAVTDVNVSGFSYATFEWATVTVEFYEKNMLVDSKEFTYYGDDGFYNVDVDFSGYINNLKLKVLVKARYLIYSANGVAVGPGYIERSNDKVETVLVYSAPTFSKQPELTPESFKNDKLLLSNKWYLKFYEATSEPSNNIDSYCITIRKNGLAINFTVLTTQGNIISSSDAQLSLTQTLFRNLSGEFTFDPADHGFKVGDSIDLIIEAFARNGAGNLLPSATIGNSYIVSKSCTIQTKQNGSWTEGTPYVKVGGQWKEADAVYVKVGGTWKESI